VAKGVGGKSGAGNSADRQNTSSDERETVCERVRECASCTATAAEVDQVG
jgi:hypothetical protein